MLAAFDRRTIKHVHAKNCWKHLCRNPQAELADIPGLPMQAQELLCGTEVVPAQFSALTSTVHQVQRSVDGTIKLLIRLQVQGNASQQHTAL